MKKYLPFRLWIFKQGFTLIELSVVLVLLAIFLFLAGAQYDFLHRMIVRSELEKIYSICYYLQRVAMVKNKPEYLQFNVDKNSYTYRNHTYTLASHVLFGAASGVKGPPAHPANVINNPITFPSNRIVFHPEGVITAGTMYLTDSRKKYMYALSCAVAHVSYMRKYFYSDNTWQLIS